MSRIAIVLRYCTSFEILMLIFLYSTPCMQCALIVHFMPVSRSRKPCSNYVFSASNHAKPIDF